MSIVVGTASYSNGEQQFFTDPKEFIKTVHEDTAENSLRAGDCGALYFCLVLFRPALLYRLGLRNFLRPDRYLGNSGSGNLFSKERHHSSGDCFPGKSCWHSHGCGVAAGHHPADQVCNTGQSLSIIRLSAKDERCEPPVFLHIRFVIHKEFLPAFLYVNF